MNAPRDDVSHLCPPLPLPAEMACWDALACEMGLPGVMLMENAARAAFSVLREHIPNVAGLRVWLIMGSGNNGGDAAGLARCLLDAGALPILAMTRAQGDIRGDAARHLRMARAAGVPVFSLGGLLKRAGSGSAADVVAGLRRILGDEPDVLVDGILGTGFGGSLRIGIRRLVTALNMLPLPRFRLALDIPTGLDGISGRPAPTAFRADATVTFAAAKPGVILPWSREWTGRLHIRDIGMPIRIRETGPCGARLLHPAILRPFRRIPGQGHKGTFGHVAVIGGTAGLSGAAHLAARGALRAGAGRITVLCPRDAAGDIRCGMSEIMVRALPVVRGSSWDGAWTEEEAGFLRDCSAVVVGPGMGRDPSAEDFLQRFLEAPRRPPAVLDADAVVLLARRPHLLHLLSEDDILTPHPGEAGMLLAWSAQDVQRDRWEAARRIADLSAAAVVLKGAGSLILQGDSAAIVSPHDVPQLSVGGSGDVLAGCAGAILARAALPETDARHALAAAVLLHIRAGEICAERFPHRGCGASDIADALPAAWDPSHAHPAEIA